MPTLRGVVTAVFSQLFRPFKPPTCVHQLHWPYLPSSSDNLLCVLHVLEALLHLTMVLLQSTRAFHSTPRAAAAVASRASAPVSVDASSKSYPIGKCPSYDGVQVTDGMYLHS
jgi:hypothetical protein